MNTITHALLPVILASMVERVDCGEERKGLLSNRKIVLIGLMGAAPDLLNPHLSLEARYTSWSHGFPFWVALTLALMVAAFMRSLRFSPALALWASLAYFAHLLCDLISGGIPWLYPLGTGVIGECWVPPRFWAWIDAGGILIVYGLWRIAPDQFRGSRQRAHETKREVADKPRSESTLDREFKIRKDDT